MSGPAQPQRDNLRRDHLLQQLQKLAAAKDLRSFADASKALQVAAPLDPSNLAIDLRRPDTGYWMQLSWATGLRLLSGAPDVRGHGGSILDAPEPALTLINTLCALASAYLQGMTIKRKAIKRDPANHLQSETGLPHTAALQVEMGMTVEAAQKMTKEGVLQALAGFCSAAAAHLHSSRAQQEQQDQPQPVILPVQAAELIEGALHFWDTLQQWWPGKTLVGRHGLVITVKPVVALAAAVITNNVTTAAETNAGSGSNSASSSAGSSAGASTVSQVAVEAYRVGVRLVASMHSEGGITGPPFVPVPIVKELVAAGDILLLEAALIGSQAHWMWRQQQRQQQTCTLEPHHVRLLEKLGCPGLELPIPSEVKPSEHLHAEIFSIMRLLGVATRAMEPVNQQEQQQQQPQEQQEQQFLTTNTANSNAAAAAALLVDQRGSDHNEVYGTVPLSPSDQLQNINSHLSHVSSFGCRELPAAELALTLLELLVLLPPNLQHMLLIQVTVIDIIHFTLAAARAGKISSCFNRRLLLEPILFYVGPAVNQLLQTAGQQQKPQQKPSNSGASAAAATTAVAFGTTLSHDQQHQRLWESLGALLLQALSPGDEDYQEQLAAAVLKQPHTAINSLCTGMRAIAAGATSHILKDPTEAEDIMSCIAFKTAMAIMTVYEKALDAINGTAAAGVSSDVIAPNAAELSTSQLRQKLQSLLLCCSKAAALMTRKLDAKCLIAGLCLAAAVAAASAGVGCLCLSLIQQPVADSQSSSSVSSADPAANVQPWVLLCARTINMIGAAAHKLAGLREAAKVAGVGLTNSNPAPHSGLVTDIASAVRTLQDLLHDALQLSHAQRRLLAAAASEGQPVVAQAVDARMLLQQQDAVILALEAAVKDISGLCSVVFQASEGSSSSSEEAIAEAEALLSRLAQQLQESGIAVCAALPVPFCCNNPGCCSFRGESEQQLVSGKGCVCGGCQVARYCGTDCQTAHWQQHKAVCKRIKKQRAAAT